MKERITADIIRKTIASIRALDADAMRMAQDRWDSLAKPQGSLGKAEELVVQLAGAQRTADIDIARRAHVIFCADNGVTDAGVAGSPKEVTALMAALFSQGKSAVALMCRRTDTDVFPIDIGIATDVPGTENRKVAYGTKNFLQSPAMTREEALEALAVGIDVAKERKADGYRLLLAGEMGIGNTTTTAAVTSVLLGRPPEECVGRGAGLSDEALENKKEVIAQAIKKHKPLADDPVDVIAKVGGFDIAGMAGFYLGAAAEGIPVILDGVISAAAALVACRMAPEAAAYLLPSHMSAEPAMQAIMKELHKEPVLRAGFRLGEGTGAVALLPVIELAKTVYDELLPYEALLL